MAKVLTLEQAAKVFAWLVLAAALLFLGPRFADRLIFAPEATTRMRLIGIAISILSVVPWLGFVAWGFGVADEYNRQVMLIGTAFAFALAILFSMAAQLMADAHLVDEVLTLNLPIAFILWMLGMGASALYHRVRG